MGDKKNHDLDKPNVDESFLCNTHNKGWGVGLICWEEKGGNGIRIITFSFNHIFLIIGQKLL